MSETTSDQHPLPGNAVHVFPPVQAAIDAALAAAVAPYQEGIGLVARQLGITATAMETLLALYQHQRDDLAAAQMRLARLEGMLDHLTHTGPTSIVQPEMTLFMRAIVAMGGSAP